MPQPAASSICLTKSFAPICVGALSVRLAANEKEVHQAQRLRYQVFCGEMGAQPTPEMASLKRDFDRFDPLCDHLLVLDDAEDTTKVVGTYRLLRQSRLEPDLGFYTESEFDVGRLKNLPGEVMELGRSCVAPEYRNRAVMQLLWRGIAAYTGMHRVGMMFGCGSFLGTDLDEHAMLLSYLYHYHLAPEDIRTQALAKHYHSINLVPKHKIDPKRSFSALPTLIKGYLRLGGFIGDGAVIDPVYNTTDVCIIVRTGAITQHYAKRYAGSLPTQDKLPF